MFSDHHAVPHGLNPLSTQNSENDEQRVGKVHHVPAQLAVFVYFMAVLPIASPKKLHPYYSKNENDDSQDEGQITQCSQGVTNDFN